MSKAQVRSTLAGDFNQPCDCLEVASGTFSTTLKELAEQARQLEERSAIIMGIQFFEYHDPYQALALMWVADAPRADPEVTQLDKMIARLEAVGGDARRIHTLESRIGILEAQRTCPNGECACA